MTLRELFEGAADVAASDLPPVEVTSLAYSTATVKPGALFFCVPGFKVDGHDFATEAVERGAVALVCERVVDAAGAVPQVLVDDVRATMAPVAARFFGDPTTELEMVGVTGTNGKTTIAYLVRSILDAAGRKCGLLGTIQSVVGGVVEPVERTTPEAIDLQATFRRMLEAGDRACAIEVSSHATALHRTDCIRFDCAIFTNLTPEHLDFHETMDEYYESKRLLFFPPGNVPPPRVSVVNVDDEYGKRLATELVEAGRRVDTFSLETPSCYRASGAEPSGSGTSFTVTGPAGESSVLDVPLMGDFNVSNALAALVAARALGVELEVVCTTLAGAEQVPGRFERVDCGQDFLVVVDYAHTPDSLASVLRTARRVTPAGARLHAVFGCGGDRDRQKRPQMGRIGAELADRPIVTSDNPRNEDPEAIIAEILAGVEPSGEAPIVEIDRRRAIEFALAGARTGDTVVIAGKGHEQGQEFKNGEKIPFDDREVAREALADLAKP